MTVKEDGIFFVTSNTSNLSLCPYIQTVYRVWVVEAVHAMEVVNVAEDLHLQVENLPLQVAIVLQWGKIHHHSYQ